MPNPIHWDTSQTIFEAIKIWAKYSHFLGFLICYYMVLEIFDTSVDRFE